VKAELVLKDITLASSAWLEINQIHKIVFVRPSLLRWYNDSLADTFRQMMAQHVSSGDLGRRVTSQSPHGSEPDEPTRGRKKIASRISSWINLGRKVPRRSRSTANTDQTMTPRLLELESITICIATLQNGQCDLLEEDKQELKNLVRHHRKHGGKLKEIQYCIPKANLSGTEISQPKARKKSGENRDVAWFKRHGVRYTVVLVNERDLERFVAHPRHRYESNFAIDWSIITFPRRTIGYPGTSLKYHNLI
jgi:hypothetical protein